MHSNIDIHSSSSLPCCTDLSSSEKIATERASLSYEVGKSVQQLTEGNKELECMSIRCDVWRSKFTASRLIINYILIRGGGKEEGG